MATLGAEAHPEAPPPKYTEKDRAYSSDVSDGAATPPRRASESSASASEYDFNDDIKRSSSMAQTPSQTSKRTLNFYRTKRATHGIITNEARQSVYMAEVSKFTPGTPDVSLHRIGPQSPLFTQGSDMSVDAAKSTPVVAVAKFPKFSRAIEMGLETPSSKPSSQQQQQVFNYHTMRCTDTFPIKRGHYEFRYLGRTLEWKRTHRAEHNPEANAVSRHMSPSNLKLVDKSTDQVVAVFMANYMKSWKKRGKLVFFEPVPENSEFEVVVVLAISSLLEKIRRKANHSAAGGAGAAGAAGASGGGGGC